MGVRSSQWSCASVDRGTACKLCRFYPHGQRNFGWFHGRNGGRPTGFSGGCVSTLGPGATNLATGVGCAWLDRTPLIAITCNVATDWIERRVQMRIDHHALYKPITKSTFSLRSDGFADTLAEAVKIAKLEPPGPVHLDLPEDVGLIQCKPRLLGRGASLKPVIVI